MIKIMPPLTTASAATGGMVFLQWLQGRLQICLAAAPERPGGPTGCLLLNNVLDHTQPVLMERLSGGTQIIVLNDIELHYSEMTLQLSTKEPPPPGALIIGAQGPELFFHYDNRPLSIFLETGETQNRDGIGTYYTSQWEIRRRCQANAEPVVLLRMRASTT